ncbi:hypothetical protein [Motiliproteus sp. MSK22-1]|uniref:hypothetical protein n=1 Tax=Motiliproteus sp. MSK22-1 TaxID=1897630 RepID=UPI0009760C5F|nr:hypothetical protein [Motiliproteus sp. MSK22-1]OMH26649.1 hypothetical protein BGP75_23425 [Motiliproteus sp. MSK22-1]
MSKCSNCDLWQIPRGFQRASDYAATSVKLLEAINRQVLTLVSDENFEGGKASNQNWPKHSVSASFECTKCGKGFALVVDVDACRGGFHTNP